MSPERKVRPDLSLGGFLFIEFMVLSRQANKDVSMSEELYVLWSTTKTAVILIVIIVLLSLGVFWGLDKLSQFQVKVRED